MRRIAAFLAVAVVLLGLAAHGRDRLDDWVAQTVLPPILSEVAVEVRARDGALLRAFAVEGGRMRLAMQPDQADPQFIAMLIAYEDKRFHNHGGVDLRAMLRAAAQAAWHGEIVSGGSTLTMQVARLLENSGTGSFKGKLRQMRVALALERRLSKVEILSLYLHHAPYGGAVEGLRAASLAWFGKEPQRLTQAEAALLIALPQAPEVRRPDRHPQTARAARDRVLSRLDLIADARQPDVPKSMRTIPQDAPHLAASLRHSAPAALRLDTTIDRQLQRRMQELAQRAVAGQASGVSAAIIVADHGTGEILAHVGSPAFSSTHGALGFVDMTVAKRSPGSTLKPLVYGLAFDQGLVHPNTLINDAPVSFGGYAPQNFDGRFRGVLTVRDALVLSLNIPPVLLTHELGAARLMSGLRRAGADPQLPSGQAGLAIALGGVGISLHDLVQLYAGIAQGGKARQLSARRQKKSPLPKQFISPVAAWQVSNILSGIAPPNGAGAVAGQIAYKTGTSYGHRDAWAIGFDGQHVVGVWLGRPDGTPVPGAFGGALAAPVVFEAFGRIGPDRAPLPAPPPETLIQSTAHLPEPLQRFRSRAAVFAADPDRPVVTFPPDGAVLQRSGFGVPLKVQAGKLPMTVLVDGMPMITHLRGRDVLLPLKTAGFTRISVVDARGQSSSVEIRLD
ncbi:penicillin-binding protein 1C [Sulfitobacter sp. F26169L]|uniref:penicillin-binding protein 1C n=1 Tax=Sulfitobacter sp. F26169L TaxID=2996015 RepID=UPI002260B927|nr:penicillin-binding protein 1C [Sulfitobacter sp. F26169L]MCX7565737.1 penicillin-binding protein 1C [Sulfitobacter sp. F26169L]